MIATWWLEQRYQQEHLMDICFNKGNRGIQVFQLTDREKLSVTIQMKLCLTPTAKIKLVVYECYNMVTHIDIFWEENCISEDL